MHRALTARLLRQALRVGETAPSTGVPLYLCPAVVGLSSKLSNISLRASTTISQRRANHTEAVSGNIESTAESPSTELLQKPVRRLPLTCSGCGAFTQTEDPEQLGYYDVDKRRVREWLHPIARRSSPLEGDEDKIVNAALESLDQSRLKELGLDPATLVEGDGTENESMSCAIHLDSQT